MPVPAFQRIRFEEHFADFRHLKSGYFATLARRVPESGGVTVTIWTTYYDGQGRGALVTLDVPEAPANDPEVLLAVPDRLATFAGHLCEATPADAARFLFPTLVEAYNLPDERSRFFRFTVPPHPGIWRVSTPGTPVPTHPM